MKNLAVIPARRGSKRIPGKNIRPFMGLPIISYSIKAALQSGMFDEVMVSTDDQEIAEVGRQFGAQVPFLRSDKNSDDFAVIADVLQEVLSEYRSSGIQFDYLCCIYAASPFVTSAKLRESGNLIVEKKADFVVPVVKFGFPIQRALKLTEKGNLEYIWPENMNRRSQDLETTYHDAGQFFWAVTDVYFGGKEVSEYRRLPFLLSELEVQDIDDEIDWAIAEIKFRQMTQKH